MMTCIYSADGGIPLREAGISAFCPEIYPPPKNGGTGMSHAASLSGLKHHD
jgi:hypothetical protein